MKGITRSRSGVAGVLVLAVVAVACSSSKKAAPPTTAAPGTTAAAAAATTTSEVVVKSSRGYDGTTIKVAGIGALSTGFAGAELGTEARFKRANDTNEVPGIKFQFVEMVDDKQDPATALSEVRRFVTQDQIFAIVPDFSDVNPGSYLVQQHVPFVGFAFDNAYCSPTTPSTSIWGFGFNGCLVPTNPPKMPDSYGELFKFVSNKTGKAHPSALLFSADVESGKESTKTQASAAEGAGFNVVYAKGEVPVVVSDYTPYVQRWLSSDSGKAPDTIICLLSAQCIPVWQALKAAGYSGTYYTTIGGSAVLLKALSGTVSTAFYNTNPNPAFTQLANDLNAFKPGTEPVSYSNVIAYYAADMFIQAVKAVGRDITPEAVQQALAHITWQIPGLVGPIKYPDSTVVPTPACNELLDNSNGTAWTVVEPYACSYTTYPIDPKFTG